MGGYAWKPNEEDEVLNWYKRVCEAGVKDSDWEEIAKKINRPSHAIRSKLFRLGYRHIPKIPISTPMLEDTTALTKEVTRLRQQVSELTSYRKIPTHSFEGDWVKVGIISDTHIGSLYERLDLLDGAYSVFEKEGIKDVYHAGDIIDGENVYRGHVYEIKVHGADAQVNHCVNNYPKKEGIETHFISGNHDLSFWKNAGIDIGEKIASRRSDMKYLGREEADVPILCNNVKVILRLTHPGKGTAYALSYHPQKYIDALAGGQKPHIILMGHYHKAEQLPCYRNTYLIQSGCLQSQTPYMRRQSLAAHMGFWIIEFMIKPHVLISRFKSEFTAFYEGQTT
jgi:predicted phosphodiesterase